MHDVVRPPHPLRRRLPDDAQVSFWTAPDGWRIRRFDWPARAGESADGGTILFAGGRGDIFEKYLETFDHWHRRGWAVVAFDWRGHGGSGRSAGRASVGHVDSFGDLVGDLAALWQGLAAMPGPRIAIGHSMGGHVVLRALAERAIAPDAAVLLSPMVRIRSPLGDRLSGALAHWRARRGDPARPAWRPRPATGTQVDSDAMLTGDYGRLLDEHWWHERMPGLRLGPPSWGWLAEAFASSRRLRGDTAALRRIAVPVLVLAADGDRLTDSRASARVARHLPDGQMTRFAAGAGHELLREVDAVRNPALAAIDAFLAAV
ncbi:alpha/beta hydrolase [Sphingomonas donggukensis]|uniref:Alpha/beta hydrolase n=1 Tax=Sphingomonas donggukensis TaxID=2949093 RepID=A0ABY4TR79_9SPHN|nr:alpha/beta hydrolase [Sphingomonas donggukensis]URW74885.1 alpha/beta hydrolase [Sphingomonas donggukensis]